MSACVRICQRMPVFFMFIKLKILITRSIPRLKIKNQADKKEVCEISKKIIRKELIKVVKKNAPASIDFDIGNFKNKTLEVVCGSSVLASELRLRHGSMVSKINQELNNLKIKEIKFKIK